MLCEKCGRNTGQTQYCFKCGEVYEPTESEIEKRTLEIQKTWSKSERRKRAGNLRGARCEIMRVKSFVEPAR